MYAGSLEKTEIRAGDVVVDIGTGRAELPVVALERGASLAIGVEYSRDALTLARQTVSASSAVGKVLLVAADARVLPIPDASADLVTMLDVVEHLAPDELRLTLKEIHRVLRPGGRLFAHTFPTRTVYNVTYRLQRSLVPSRRKRWPVDPRNEYELRMHVNEQTKRSFSRSLKEAGFRGVSVTHGEWVWEGFVPEEKARRLYHQLARSRFTAPLGVSDLWAHATR